MTEILVIDDDLGPFQPGLQHALRGHRLHLAFSGEEGLEVLAKNPKVACVLLDMMMPAHFADDEQREGIEVLKRLRQARPDLPVIMLTVLKDVDLVVEAMKEGAYHYITKPIDRDKLRETVARATENRHLKERVSSMSRARDAMLKVEGAAPEARDGFHGMVGRHPLMQELYSRIDRVARFDDMNVVILGETGAGKDLAAKAIHECSPRSKGPFVAVNCGAVAESVLESELFGHEKGAFTGADAPREGLFVRAHEGTLFLDEIGDMPPLLQVKLLRAIENKEVTPVGGKARDVDVRIVCATHRDFMTLKDEGKFREDLYFRIWDLPISVPPLRKRREDIPLLVDHFLRRLGDQYGMECSIAPDALALLAARDWPGNVRELHSFVRRLLVFAEKGRIVAADVYRQLDEQPPDHVTEDPDEPPHGSDPMGTGTTAKGNEDDENGEYPEIDDMTEFRRIHGEVALKRILVRAVREGGSAKAAMALLGMPQERYEMFRQWLHRLDISVRDTGRAKPDREGS